MNDTLSNGNHQKTNGGCVVFFGDAHLGFNPPHLERPRVERLLRFIRSLRGKAEYVYILGDLYDFWFEYRSFVPRKYTQVLFEIYNLIQSGTRVFYIGGNHDWWIGDYLQNEVGIVISREPMSCNHQGKRIYLDHGDGLYRGDYGYKLLKKILRNPVSIKLFRLIHPDLGAMIARLTSRSSRQFLAQPPPNVSKPSENFRSFAEHKFALGYDAAVFGHCHIPFIDTTEDHKTLIILGDWIHHFSYAVLENGRFRLERFEENTE